MLQYPQEEFGRLLHLDEAGITKFNSAMVKFMQRGLQTNADLRPPVNETFPINQHLYPLMVSLPNGALSMIYLLVRQAPEVMRRPSFLILISNESYYLNALVHRTIMREIANKRKQLRQCVSFYKLSYYSV